MNNNASYKKIKGVNAVFHSNDQALIEKCKAIEAALLKEKIVAAEAIHTPWLISPDVFTFDSSFKTKLEEIGQGILLFFDAIQQLYPFREAVRTALDYGVEEDLKGLNLEKRINTFRLDVVVEKGIPKVAEVEEPYAGIGLMHAISKAYSVNCDYYYKRIAESGIQYIFIDDQWEAYWGELAALQRRLKEQESVETTMAYLSTFKEEYAGVALRYEYVRDLAQYDVAHRAKIINKKIDYINPLFHGYNSKAVFALFFDASLKEDWLQLLGETYYKVLFEAFPKSEILVDFKENKRQELIENRKKTVIKIIYSPEDVYYNWGSRGVYFGDTNKKSWVELLSYIQKGEIPHQPQIKNVTYMQSELIESDRYDLPFWDRENHQMSLMPKARIRLQPIFYRKDDAMELVASMATFVNTSKKVHLGNHAIQVPVEYR